MKKVDLSQAIGYLILIIIALLSAGVTYAQETTPTLNIMFYPAPSGGQNLNIQIRSSASAAPIDLVLLKKYLTDPAIADSGIKSVGVMGNHGWALSTADKVDIDLSQIMLAGKIEINTTYDQSVANYFRGNLFCVNNNDQPGWLKLDEPGLTVSFGMNDNIVVPDGGGGWIIEFVAGDLIPTPTPTPTETPEITPSPTETPIVTPTTTPSPTPTTTPSPTPTETPTPTPTGIIFPTVSRPTIYFNQDLLIKIMVPDGFVLSSHIVGTLIGDVNRIGVSGPTGWELNSDEIIPWDGKFPVQIQTSWEPWGMNHFRGQLFVVTDQNQVCYLNLGPPASPEWDIFFGGNKNIIEDDGSGKSIIDFSASDWLQPTPIPTETPTPTPTETPVITPTATPSPTPTATATATPSPTETPVITPTATPTPSPTPSPTPTETPVITPTPTPTPISSVEYDFTDGTHGWKYAAKVANMDTAICGNDPNGLFINPNGSFNSFAFWLSPVLELQSGKYRATFRVTTSNVTEGKTLEFRIRSNSVSNWGYYLRGITPWDSVLGMVPREYKLDFEVKDGDQQMIFCFDLLSFNQNLNINSSIFLQSFKLQKIE